MKSLNLDRYDAEESREESQHLVGLSSTEKRALKARLECNSSGHSALAGIWRTLTPGTDGRLHANCPNCKARVSRSAFIN
jgi:hypothetical protein